jgi:uncharacterized SAM-binding protein YcdF (DUF218 family)
VTIVLVAVLVVVVVFAGLTARLFLWPSSSQPRHVDAVVFLSGDFGGRLVEARRLINNRVSDVLVKVGAPDNGQAERLCADQSRPFEAICLRPAPDSTRAEARAVARLAKQRHWHKIAVVTSTYHLTRAGVLFRRCFDGDVQMVAAKEHFSVGFRLRQLTHEWPRFIYAETLDRGC